MVKKRSSMKSKTKKLLVITAVFAVGLTGAAKADLATQIDACLKRPSQKKVQYAIHIVKVDSGKTLYSHNAKKAMVPASNMKIIVTAAALKYLGECRYRCGLEFRHLHRRDGVAQLLALETATRAGDHHRVQGYHRAAQLDCGLGRLARDYGEPDLHGRVAHQPSAQHDEVAR